MRQTRILGRIFEVSPEVHAVSMGTCVYRVWNTHTHSYEALRWEVW